MGIIPHLLKRDMGKWEPLQVQIFALVGYPLPVVRLKNVNFLIPGMVMRINVQ